MRDNMIIRHSQLVYHHVSKGNSMDSKASKVLRISDTTSNNTATISLEGAFSFPAHREFKAAYKKHLDNPKVGNIIINLSDIEYLDSSALGMLLVLRDLAIAANKNLTLSRPSPIAASTLDIAGFYKLFTIS